MVPQPLASQGDGGQAPQEASFREENILVGTEHAGHDVSSLHVKAEACSTFYLQPVALGFITQSRRMSLGSSVRLQGSMIRP